MLGVLFKRWVGGFGALTTEFASPAAKMEAPELILGPRLRDRVLTRTRPVAIIRVRPRETGIPWIPDEVRFPG